MLYWALVFLIVALVAAALGFGGIAGASAGLRRFCSSSFWSCFWSPSSPTSRGGPAYPNPGLIKCRQPWLASRGSMHRAEQLNCWSRLGRFLLAHTIHASSLATCQAAASSS
jgi:hypothetical protein